jgi:hypothetical protein
VDLTLDQTPEVVFMDDRSLQLSQKVEGPQIQDHEKPLEKSLEV